MSGRWMTAGDRFAGYRSDVPGTTGDGYAGNLSTRAVLRELCRIAHDAGIAQHSVASLAARVGIGERTAKYAMARLQRDGVITQAIRGTGNRHGSQPRASFWVIHQLADVNGEMWPDTEWLRERWQGYLLTKRYNSLSRDNRRAVFDAWAGPVDNSEPGTLLSASYPPTRGNPLPNKSQGRSLFTAAPVHGSTRTHPKRAERARGKLTVITTRSSEEGHPA